MPYTHDDIINSIFSRISLIPNRRTLTILRTIPAERQQLILAKDLGLQPGYFMPSESLLLLFQLSPFLDIIRHLDAYKFAACSPNFCVKLHLGSWKRHNIQSKLHIYNQPEKK
ncbi:hypothetical protein PROFUN_09528 [Planoprotostelium fungivorum]|uniref:Uncharacterized protein n=1 Tax=Planoprotostelium fungivorum TaxID=1890364 RepID=A0A2P6MT02_9EUKA|nr:hypothetical protein PROFUN_09528 [Planoprotostelium fungivorum]